MKKGWGDARFREYGKTMKWACSVFLDLLGQKAEGALHLENTIKQRLNIVLSIYETEIGSEKDFRE